MIQLLNSIRFNSVPQLTCNFQVLYFFFLLLFQFYCIKNTFMSTYLRSIRNLLSISAWRFSAASLSACSFYSAKSKLAASSYSLRSLFSSRFTFSFSKRDLSFFRIRSLSNVFFGMLYSQVKESSLSVAKRRSSSILPSLYLCIQCCSETCCFYCYESRTSFCSSDKFTVLSLRSSSMNVIYIS